MCFVSTGMATVGKSCNEWKRKMYTKLWRNGEWRGLERDAGEKKIKKEMRESEKRDWREKRVWLTEWNI